MQLTTHNLQRPHAPGVKTSELAPEKRYGHGIILAKDKEAAGLAREAFEKAVMISDSKGIKHRPTVVAKEDDTRAVYTVIQRYKFTFMNNFHRNESTQVAVDRWTGEICTTVTEGTIWHYAVLVYKLPALGGLQITKIITPENPNDSERLVLVLRMNAEWEKRLDSFPGNENGEIPMRLGIGTYNLRKRRAGEKVQTTKKPAAAKGNNTAGTPPDMEDLNLNDDDTATHGGNEEGDNANDISIEEMYAQ